MEGLIDIKKIINGLGDPPEGWRRVGMKEATLIYLPTDKTLPLYFCPMYQNDTDISSPGRGAIWLRDNLSKCLGN